MASEADPVSALHCAEVYDTAISYSNVLTFNKRLRGERSLKIYTGLTFDFAIFTI